MKRIVQRKKPKVLLLHPKFNNIDAYVLDYLLHYQCFLCFERRSLTLSKIFQDRPSALGNVIVTCSDCASFFCYNDIVDVLKRVKKETFNPFPDIEKSIKKLNYYYHPNKIDLNGNSKRKYFVF